MIDPFIAFAIALALNDTEPPAKIFDEEEDAVRAGACPAAGFFRNQGVALGSVSKKASKWFASFVIPVVEGWIKSVLTSLHNQVNPSDRAAVPSAQKYGPQRSSGATTGPLAVL